MRNVVVGGCGFIGSHLVEALIARGNEVIVIDNLFSGKLDTLRNLKDCNKLKVCLEDFTNLKEMRIIFDKERPTTLFNLATIGLIRSLKDPIMSFSKEVKLAEVACQLALDGLYERLVQFSSSEVYGNVSMPIVDPENHQKNPTTAYAAGKLSADYLVTTMSELHKINSVIIRPFNAFGPNQFELELQGIIPKTINALINGRPVTLYGDGLQTRDFIFIDDLLKRMFIILRHHFSSPVGTRKKIYHICSEKDISMLDLVHKIAEVGNFDLKINFEKNRMGEVTRLVGMQTRVPGVDFVQTKPFDESLEYMVKFREGEKCA